MSGIAGIISFDRRPVEAGVIEAMTGAMNYRGPDGITCWTRGSISLGHCMLRTTHESFDESQPIVNEDESLVLVMDGWLANWEELRAELLSKGAVLRNRSDSELVLRAYELWGAECLTRIEGEFAFAIVNTLRHSCFCARDRMGLKPFFYYWSSKEFVFASELAPILIHPRVPEVPNEGLIAEYLAQEWYSRSETLWSGIVRLVGAHRMQVTINGTVIEQYWSPRLDNPIRYKRDEEYFEHYRELLTDCVRRASRSHKPAAFEVSGGLDSSAVAALGQQLQCASHLPAPGVEGYTISIPDDEYANELAYARSLGEHIGLTVHEVKPSISPVGWFADHAQLWRDFPGFPNVTSYSELYKRMQAVGHCIVLGGDGGDEWLTGTPLYFAEHLRNGQWSELVLRIKEDANSLGFKAAFKSFIRYGILPGIPPGVQSKLRLARQAFGPCSKRRKRLDSSDSSAWLSPRMRSLLEGRKCASEQGTAVAAVQRNQFSMLYNPIFDHGFERADRLGAMCGIERRSPMRDYRFVQFAFSTEERLRLSSSTTKFIHRQSLRDLLPVDILERMGKGEYSIVFRRELGRVKDLYGSTGVIRPDWVVPDAIERLESEFFADDGLLWPMWILWSIYGCQLALDTEALTGK